MCYTDLEAERGNSDKEEGPPSVKLGSPIIDTCPTAMPLLIQIEMSKAWRRIKMVNHALGISFYRSLDMMNELMLFTADSRGSMEKVIGHGAECTKDRVRLLPLGFRDSN